MFGNRGGPGTQSQGRGPVATCIRGEKGVTCAGGILVLGGAWSLGKLAGPLPGGIGGELRAQQSQPHGSVTWGSSQHGVMGGLQSPVQDPSPLAHPPVIHLSEEGWHLGVVASSALTPLWAVWIPGSIRLARLSVLSQLRAKRVASNSPETQAGGGA